MPCFLGSVKAKSSLQIRHRGCISIYVLHVLWDCLVTRVTQRTWISTTIYYSSSWKCHSNCIQSSLSLDNQTYRSWLPLHSRALDDKIITLPHSTTDLQVANIFTKAVPHVKHQFFVGKIDVDWITSIKLRGDISVVLKTTILAKYLFWFHDYTIPRVIRIRSQKKGNHPKKKGIRLWYTCCI